MKWSVRPGAWQSVRRAASLLLVAGVGCGAMSQQALAASVQAYALFEIGAASDGAVTSEKLRSTSLANCKQLIVGQNLQDVFVQIACDGGGDINQALQKLANVGGIARATIVSLKHGAN